MTDNAREHYWTQEHEFPDVALEDWFNNAVATTTNAGVFFGLPDGTFAPNSNITRAEMAVAAVRFMGYIGCCEFNVFDDIAGHWAACYINTAAEWGWIIGNEGLGGSFRPDDEISRAETAALINRMLQRLPYSCCALLEGMVVWPDNMNQDAWYYLYIQEATNSHFHEKLECMVLERWVELIAPRPWHLLELPDSLPYHIF